MVIFGIAVDFDGKSRYIQFLKNMITMIHILFARHNVVWRAKALDNPNLLFLIEYKYISILEIQN